jgi:hypothetical protein
MALSKNKNAKSYERTYELINMVHTILYYIIIPIHLH